jgi:hypothetical protein
MTRLDFANQVLSLLPADLNWTLERAQRDWWVDSRSHSGLRLTREARDLAKSVGLDSWRFAIEGNTPFLPRTMLTLNSHLECAYWLELKRPPAIELFGSREAVMFGLYRDINQFVRALGREPGARNHE